MATNKFEIKLYTFDCIGCGKCIRKCPNEVLKLVNNGMCRFICVANEYLCTGCKRCEQACRNKAIRIIIK